MSDPFALLPANLEKLASVAASESARPTMSGVLVQFDDDGYEAVATDGRILAVVTGPCGDPLGFPELDQLTSLPPSKTSAIIPGRAFGAACKAAAAAGRRAKREACGHVAVHLGKGTSVLACSDGDSAGVQSTPNLEGKFPNYRAILPKEEPKFRIEVDPRLLGTLLAVARSLADEERPRVALEFHASDRPLVLTVDGKNDQDFVGLIMPLTPEPSA
jgi:DNA polymerase III sliding clamp (beta) subunit (PCNA family)